MPHLTHRQTTSLLIAFLVLAAFTIFLGVAPQAHAQISQGVRVCNPDFPTRCVKPDASGNMPVVITSGGGGSAVTIANGADVTQGAIADSAWAGSGSGTSIAIQKYSGSKLEAIRVLLSAATAATVPANAVYVGANSGGNLTGIIQGSASVKIDVSTATTTQLVALSGSTRIYITHWDVIAGGTGNIKLVYGTGASCGSGTTDITGNYNLTAQAGISVGGGLGPAIVVPAGQALCVTTSAAVQMSGVVTYTQF